MAAKVKVKKAIIPAAGFGSRMLPISKSVPKEMIPLVDKPAIQYIVEEAVAAGIEDILIITNRGKGAIEDHFDHSPELEASLQRPGKEAFLKSVEACANLANILFVRQKEIKGLGHAVSMARSFVGDEPFLVLYGDDVIISDNPVSKQLIDAYDEFGLSALGIKEVSPEDVVKYSSMKVKSIRENLYRIDDMVEKPAYGSHMSLFAILGRCLLTPDIFDILKKQPPGAGGEIQLTDAIKTIANTAGCIGVDFVGDRYDIGNKFGVLRAQIEIGLKHPEVASELRNYLRSLNLDTI